MMKTIKNFNLPLILAAAIALALPLLAVFAQNAPQPVLTITPTNGNQFWLTITNAVATTNYEIYRNTALTDPAYPWVNPDMIVGVVGQSNFLVQMGIETLGFFRAGIGSDWDNDGAPNWGDANPTDPAIGWLTITIDSPTNGANIH